MLVEWYTFFINKALLPTYFFPSKSPAQVGEGSVQIGELGHDGDETGGEEERDHQLSDGVRPGVKVVVICSFYFYKFSAKNWRSVRWKG
jgi:hypothetical protein